METVTISARINEKKKVEFYQTMEALKTLIKKYCNDLEVEVHPDNSLFLRITFANKEELEKNINIAEFNILKGTVRSLCENVSISFNDNSIQSTIKN